MLNDSLWVFESCLLGVSIPQNHMYIPFTTLYSESNPHDTMQSPLFRMRYSQKIKKDGTLTLCKQNGIRAVEKA